MVSSAGIFEKCRLRIGYFRRTMFIAVPLDHRFRAAV
jgi:hypothetical protein